MVADRNTGNNYDHSELIIEGAWAFPMPHAGERLLHAWVVDDCAYVLITLGLEAGEEYHVRMYGYDMDGMVDEWASVSPGPWPELCRQLDAEMAELANYWFGRLRQADLSEAADWRVSLRVVLGDGIVQVGRMDAAGDRPEQQAA